MVQIKEEIMKFVIQRVSEASVSVDGEVIGQIGNGFMVLMGAEDADTPEIAEKMVKKMIGLRIFQDEEGKTNLNLKAVGGSLLIVSQFTLYADCRKGNRPSFVKAGSPAHAEEMYEYVLELCRREVPDTACGSFGAYMQISLVNDGPFTVVWDSKELFG